MVGLTSTPSNDKILDTMFKWIRGGLAGCHFAIMLATNVNRAKWRAIVLPRLESSNDVDEIESLLEDACSDDVEAVMVIFRDIEKIDELVRLVNALSSHSNWSCEHKAVGPSPDGRNRVGAGLRWRMPDGSTSHAIGFGPFGVLPPTRRAPYTAITIPVCGRGKYRESGRDDERHLCDMANSEFRSSEEFGKVWTRTEELKASMIDDHDRDAAKARVTFCFPSEFQSQLT